MWPPWRLGRGKPARSDSAETQASRRPAVEVALRRAGARRRLRGRTRLPPRTAERALREPGPAVRAAPAPVPRPAAEPRYIVRFDMHQRLQHIIMLLTFTILVVTGLPQKFPDVEASRWWVELLGGIGNVRNIHHWTAYVMLGDCVYHALYLVFRMGVQGRLDALRMIPTPKDFEDAADMFLYYLGAKEERPKFDRFTYLEKFDYWAVFWGLTIMGGSGLILLFPVPVTHVLPGQAVIAAFRAHSDEALLAVAWIFVVHLFYSHISPRYFPFNPAIFTGRLPAAVYREEHPLEFEQLLEAGLVVFPEPEDAQSEATRRAGSGEGGQAKSSQGEGGGDG